MNADEYDILVGACRKAVKEAAGPMTKPSVVESIAMNVAGRLSAELVKHGLAIGKTRAKDMNLRERLGREIFLAKHGMTYEDYAAGRPQTTSLPDEYAAPVLVALENMGIRL
jgi:hypothetical protein